MLRFETFVDLLRHWALRRWDWQSWAWRREAFDTLIICIKSPMSKIKDFNIKANFETTFKVWEWIRFSSNFSTFALASEAPSPAQKAPTVAPLETGF